MDLDNEELKATRRMNGADKIMEEDIIEELTKVNPSNLSEEGLKLFNKINEIIDRNKELEEENKKKSLEIICYQEELENSIPISLVEEKIEELDKKINDIPDNEGNFSKAILIRTKITLQELLEKRK